MLNVTLICESCESVVALPLEETNPAAELEQIRELGWYIITHPDDPDSHFCKLECLLEWAVSQAKVTLG